MVVNVLGVMSMVVLFFLVLSVLVIVSFQYNENFLFVIKQPTYSLLVLLFGLLFFSMYLFLLSKQNLFQSDMIAYFNNLQDIHYLISFNSIPGIFKQVEFEKGFIIIQVIIGYFTNNSQTYGLIMYSLILLLPLTAAGYYFGRDSVPFIMIHYVFFNVFNTTSLIVIRQGIAIGILLISLTVYLKDHKKTAMMLMLLSAQYHSTAYIMVFALIIIELFKINLKFLLYVWGFTAILYIMNWNQKIIQYIPFDSKYLDSYTGDLWSNQSAIYGQMPNSFRYLLASAIFLLFILILKRYFSQNNCGMLFLIKVYVAWNTVFLLFGFVAFSSRIALYSWLLFPFISFYAFWSNRVLKNYYPVFLIMWIVIGIIGLPIFGWMAV